MTTTGSADWAEPQPSRPATAAKRKKRFTPGLLGRSWGESLPEVSQQTAFAGKLQGRVLSFPVLSFPSRAWEREDEAELGNEEGSSPLLRDGRHCIVSSTKFAISLTERSVLP